jgi:hypothetical protein
VLTSTNKVYGGIEDIDLNSEGGIYYLSNMSARQRIDKLRPLGLCSNLRPNGGAIPHELHLRSSSNG